VTTKSIFLTAGEAARQLGISTKALRLYEDRALVSPGRTGAGWRSYGPRDLERAEDIVRLRKLGLGLAVIRDILEADPSARQSLLATHRLRIEQEQRRLEATLRAIDAPRSEQSCSLAALTAYVKERAVIAFDLPWPWGGERFALAPSRGLSFITGPLGSGKTRFAMALAKSMPDGRFLGLDRLSAIGAMQLRHAPDGEDPALFQEIDWQMAAGGATRSRPLALLIDAIYAGRGPLVIDMIEQDLDHATQEVLVATLRRHKPATHPLFLMTRSSAILDLSRVESGETIIYCPANHSPPMIVTGQPTCPGYEAVATCLAAPDIRARTAGLIAAWAPDMRAPNSDSRETFC
jgi:DNA-binding transcriptional MerR regulator